MSKEQPHATPVPATCPLCAARVRTAGKITDQKKALVIRGIAGLVLCGATIAGVLVLWFVMGVISPKLVLVVVAVALLPSGIVLGFANAIPKVKEARCSACRWSDHYLVQVTNPEV